MAHASLPFALLLVLALLVGAAGADDAAPEPVHFAGSYALSPDGTVLVLAWRGDLWRVASTGGALRRLTSHPAEEASPRISPDGATLAFTSTRSGSRQIWVMPLEGGVPRRITSHTEDCRLEGWFPDGRAVLMRQSRDHAWRDADRLFRRPLAADAPAELLFDAHAYDARVAPDGRRIAFVREGVAWTRKGYRGSQAAQVWIHDLDQGTFAKLTEGDHGERDPRWLPDGRHLVIASEEDGAYNLYVHDLETGARRRLTAFQDDGVVLPTVSADGSVLVFRRLGTTWRMAPGVQVPPHELELRSDGDETADRTLRRELDRASAVAFTGDAREMAFVAGGDVWVMDTELREPVRVTDTPEEESEPVFAPDHQTLFFVRELDGRPDIWTARRADPERPWWRNDAFELARLTDDEAPERGLAFTPDGARLAFVHGPGDLVWMKPDGAEREVLVSTWGGLTYAFSPDARWIAYATADADFNRDVWIAPTDRSAEPCNVSRHPDDDGSPTFSPDGKLLAFTGRRFDDEVDLYYVWLRKEDDDRSERDRKLAKALEVMKGRKPKAPPAKSTPSPSTPAKAEGPAGTWEGTILGGDLPAAGLDLRVVITHGPDGAFQGRVRVGALFDGSLTRLEIDGATLRAQADTPIGRVEVEGSFDGDRLSGTWKTADGAEGTFEARRQAAGPPAAAAPPSAPEAGAKKEAAKKLPPPVAIDLEGISDRIRRIAIPNTTEHALCWMGDGARLAFEASVNGQAGLYTVTFPDALAPKRLTGTQGQDPVWLAEAKKIGWRVDGRPATLDAGGRGKTFGFKARQVVDVAARNAAAFDQAWRVIGQRFYDPALNGRDWDAVRAKYRPLASQALTPEELETVVDLMLGELNGSHLGFGASSGRWSPPGWREETGHLGVRFDRAAPGEGLRVEDVIPDSPADHASTRIAAGERVLAIDGAEVDRGTNVARLLTGDPDRDVLVRVRATDGAERDVRLRPISPRTARRLLYDAWVEDARERVEGQSDGRLGYLHVRGMNWSSFQRFEEALYAVGHGRDGLIIDVRDNGGGFTTDHLLTSLTQPVHAFTVARGGRPGYPQDRMVYARWTKPIVVLINQNSFSNAEIFAHAIRTLGRGPLVGVPTAGGVISTGSTRIMDVGTLRLPFRGWFTLPDGEDMEHRGCPPDHVVWPVPGDATDRQLEKAVDVLLEEVEAWARRPAPTPHYASARGTRR